MLMLSDAMHHFWVSKSPWFVMDFFTVWADVNISELVNILVFYGNPYNAICQLYISGPIAEILTETRTGERTRNLYNL